MRVLSMLKTFGAAGVFATCASLAAAATAFTCNLTKDPRSNLMPEVLFIGHDTASNTVTISDPIILYFNDQQPLQGRAVRKNDKTARYAWTVRGVPVNQGKTVSLIYRADIQMKTGRVFVRLNADDFRGMTGRGTCKIETVTQ